MGLPTSVEVARCLDRLKRGDARAGEELLALVCGRLTQLAHLMFRNYRRVRRWEETDDVVQGALLRLHRALQSEAPEAPLNFYRLAATQIRRELIDLGRRHFGPLGLGANQDSVGGHSSRLQAPAPYGSSPDALTAWTELHERAQGLPEREREVFDLLWYHDLKLADAASALGVSTRTVIRRWQSACLLLHEALGGLLPEVTVSHS